MCMIRYSEPLLKPCEEDLGGYGDASSIVSDNCSETFANYEVDVRNSYHPVLHKSMAGWDLSNTSFISTIWLMRPTWEIVSKSVVFVPIIVLGIIFNIILLHLILRNRRLRTPTNLLIANMASADLATLLICPWMFMCSDFFQNYQLGMIGCRTEGFFECAFLLTGVFNLCAVSYDRLTAIVLPCEARLTCRGARIVMVLTWIFGALLALPLIIYRTYKERQWLDFLEKFCVENRHILPIYWHVIIMLLVWVPLGVMAICYSAIFIKLDRYEQQVLRRGREHPMCVNLKTRVARMLFIVVGTFIICRLPFTVFVFWRNQRIKDQDFVNTSGFLILWSMSHYLIFSNAAINPVIYGLTNDNFKREFRTTPLSVWLFGPPPKANQNAVQLPKKKVESFETPAIVEKDEEKPETWFKQPDCKMKTLSTDCYI